MAALNFPDAPVLGQLFSSGTKTWRWGGTSWKSLGITSDTSTYTTVSANSANWDAHTDPYDDSLLQSTSGDWNSTYSTVLTESASWSIDALQIAASDETTDLTTGISTTFRSPYAMTLTDVRGSLTTAPSGSTLNVDISASGTSIFSTIITIDAETTTSVGATTPSVISNASITDDEEIKIEVQQVGTDTAGTGLKITFIGSRL